MASRKKGGDGFIGRTGNTVVYHLNGKMIKREIGITYKAPSILQLGGRQITSIISVFLSPVKEFINLGFIEEARAAKKNQHNMASSYNRLNAISGSYPDYRIDYSKVLLSKGGKPLTQDVKIEMVETGLQFTWDPSVSDSGRRWTDQAMLMAYIPELKEAVFLLNGARRTVGTDILILPKFSKTVVLETYISFIGANHKSVSNSIYTGQVLWKSL